MSDKQKIILPGKGEVILGDSEKTVRTIDREIEDESFLPVIVKRIDQGVRHPDDILKKAIHEGLEQHKRSSLSLFLSAIAAGLILGFTAMLVALACQLVMPYDNVILTRLAMAIVYPLGFIICIMSGTQLFTEHTAMAVYPVLEKQVPLMSLGKLWLIILAGNMFGTFVSSWLIVNADSVVLAGPGLAEVFKHLTHYSEGEIFLSAILAGWLMAQGGWLILSTSSGFSQIAFIFIVTFIIGFGGLHHSIAGSAEIFAGILHIKNPDYLAAARFLTWAILGNLVGGSFFVAILNYGHIKKTQ